MKSVLTVLLAFWAAVAAVVVGLLLYTDEPEATGPRVDDPQKPMTCAGLQARGARCADELAEMVATAVGEHMEKDGASPFKVGAAQMVAQGYVDKAISEGQVLTTCRRYWARESAAIQQLKAHLGRCYRRRSCRAFAACLKALKGRFMELF